MTVQDTESLAVRPLGLRGSTAGRAMTPARRHDARPERTSPGAPGRRWPIVAAVAGLAHVGAATPGGAWPAILLAVATAALAGAWPWLLAGHRQDLSAALGAVWLAVAVVTVGTPVAALLGTAAGGAALGAACRSLR